MKGYIWRPGHHVDSRDRKSLAIGVHGGCLRFLATEITQVLLERGDMKRDIELRSDTFTLPTSAMRMAMHEAEVGDNAYGEDPTVNRLEKLMAERTGHEEALYVASGTMGNLICVLTHCGRGDEIVLGNRSHLFLSEQGGPAATGSISSWPLPNERDGTLALDAIRRATRPDSVYAPRTGLICLENTQNCCGGVALTPEYIASVCELARNSGLPVHIDGERIFNAAIALGVAVEELTRQVDSVMVGLTKGLACPVGSVICGSRDFIVRARRNQRVLGGVMRQGGIVAAAGIVALEEMVDRLAEDHLNARLLAEGLNEIEGLSVDMRCVQTNLVYFHVDSKKMTPSELVARLREQGVRIALELGTPRAVTHYGIEEKDVRDALVVFRHVMKS